MFSSVLSSVFNEAFEKSFYKAAEELTGINEKTWRNGGPKSKTKQLKIPQLAENNSKYILEREKGYSKEEALELSKRMIHGDLKPSGLLSALVISFGEQYCLRWHEAEKLAHKLDNQNEALIKILKKNDFPTYKQEILKLCNEPSLKLWIESSPDFVDVLKTSCKASELSSLEEISRCWAMSAIYRIIACWDVEFQSNYIHREGSTNIEVRPLFQLLMPRINPITRTNSSGQYTSARGLFHIPMRRLLELSFTLAYFAKYRQFPSTKQISLTNIEGWMDESTKAWGKGNTAKIFRGTMNISAAEFEAIWISMCGKSKDGKLPIAPWPMYVAAQIWTHLHVTKGTLKGSRTTTGIVIPSPGIYEYWWHHYHEKIKIKAPSGKVIPWPEYFKSY